METPMELTITGAEVVDGTGSAARRCDVHVRDGRVAAMAPGLEPRGEHVVADGLTLVPGFVDMHVHADLDHVSGVHAAASLAQGVTTRVIGQDGIGYAPLDDAALVQVRRQIRGWNGDLPEISWRTMAEYLAVLDRGGSTHAAVLAPQGNLRLLTVGSADRPATGAERASMRALLAESLAAGAVGMSSGLTYAPGMYADTEELIDLARVVADAGASGARTRVATGRARWSRTRRRSRSDGAAAAGSTSRTRR
ncbi:amidohydrolase family protein [Litorihabitans aurantiacus]|uniref:Amidohydrolase 3 domain-containing protein n=1 Tax=Litorihabitans aurantiacus TaxID=1930061 RepID=A0AA38CTT6_9MICO|nr:amidohydrolase family protein [Litorihabitans aurantiacus]GMA32112.1 hypothetical protein GCM10025875_21040 [Litorihabitans aurantiacus]